jgi:hypothetical protein
MRLGGVVRTLENGDCGDEALLELDAPLVAIGLNNSVWKNSERSVVAWSCGEKWEGVGSTRRLSTSIRVSVLYLRLQKKKEEYAAKKNKWI